MQFEVYCRLCDPIPTRAAQVACSASAVRRRDLMTLAAGAAAWPLVARAQRATWRIGCLVTGSPESRGPFVAAFRQRLAEFGHVEGRDFILDLRWANGQGDRLQPLA